VARVNYVIACWTGGRRADDPRAAGDRTFMIRQHLAALEKATHSLAQITIVLADGGDAQADGYIKGIKSVGDTPVVVLVRVNTGYSYASWNHAFETYKEEFTHYIIVEDDYVPWSHNFDSALVEHADRENTYVCGLQARRGGLASISNGIIPSKVWREVHPAPYVDGATAKEGNRSQYIWTGHFGGKGFPVADYLSTHSSPFWMGNTVRWYGDLTKPAMFIPTNMRDTVCLISNIALAVPCSAREFGSIWVDDDGYKESWDKMVEYGKQGISK